MKNRFARAAAFSLLALLGGGALAAPPSQASVERLLEVSGSQQMMDQMSAQAAPMLQQALGHDLAPEGMNVTQRRTLELYAQKFEKLLQEEMSWARMKPEMIRLYQESFDQAEVDGMIAFYGSPVGRSVMSKMPLVAQKSMEMSQRQMRSLLPRLGTAYEEASAQAQREQKK